MAPKMEVEVIECETMKPSSPTPNNRRIHKLCLLDQISQPYWIPLLLFLPTTSDLISISQRSRLLKKTLSQTLESFRTFAGRLKANIAIECNDEGAEFAVTRVNCSLSMILENPDPAMLTNLTPSEALPKEALFTGPLLRVRVNFFSCSGVAIGLCLSHKAGDASTLSTFLNSWAAATAKPDELEASLIPHYVSSSIFPPQDSLASLLESYQEIVGQENVRVKRLVFPGPRIDALRSKAAGNSTVQDPTRVEAVSALIWKCAIEAASESNQRASVFVQGVNIRKVVEPPLPENAVGNMVWQYLAKKNIKSSSEAGKIELKDLAAALRKAIEELNATCKAGVRPEELTRSCEELSALWKDGGVRHLVASTWCRFPIYDADFGWGKPVWVCVPNLIVANVFVMMDTRDGSGIEVLVSVCGEEMERFERNQELLEFAQLGPNLAI